jgi:hypothetical protein
MKILVQIRINDRQETHQLDLIQRGPEILVRNPRTDVTALEPVLIPLEPSRIEKLSDMEDCVNYRGLLIDIKS